MHELSIALSILEIAEEEARRHGDAQVRAIHLKLGPLSGVVKDALLSAYELAREDTSLQEAELVIEDIPVQGFCPTCHTESAVISMQDLCCQQCGTPTTRIISGQEMEIVALEIEQ
jgi:hydrogenase nickel incorporation protein HypA/HybF